MTWYINFKAPSKRAAQVALLEHLAKNMLAQRPHARDFRLVHDALSAAIDTLDLEDGKDVTVTAAGHVNYDGWNDDVPRILGITISQFNVVQVRREPVTEQPAA